MSAITIRKLSDETKHRLRMRAAAHGKSMEAEAREILVAALQSELRPDLIWIENLIEIGNDFGGVEIPEIADQPAATADFAR